MIPNSKKLKSCCWFCFSRTSCEGTLWSFSFLCSPFTTLQHHSIAQTPLPSSLTMGSWFDWWCLIQIDLFELTFEKRKTHSWCNGIKSVQSHQCFASSLGASGVNCKGARSTNCFASETSRFSISELANLNSFPWSVYRRSPFFSQSADLHHLVLPRQADKSCREGSKT